MARKTNHTGHTRNIGLVSKSGSRLNIPYDCPMEKRTREGEIKREEERRNLVELFQKGKILKGVEVLKPEGKGRGSRSSVPK